MKRSTGYLLLAVLFTQAGCQKHLRDYKIEGTITDAYTGLPVPNAEVTLDMAYDRKYFLHSNEESRTGNRNYTDAEGHYEFVIQDRDWKKEREKEYDFMIVSSATQEGTVSFKRTPDFSSESQRFDFTVNGRGCYKLHIANVSPVNAQDTLKDLYFDTPGDVGTNPVFTGMGVNTYLGSYTHSGVRYLHSTIVKNNVITYRVDTLTLPLNPDTVFYALNY